MQNLGVYKAYSTFEDVWNVIQQLRHFYAQTVSACKATLVVIDARSFPIHGRWKIQNRELPIEVNSCRILKFDKI